PRVDVKVTVDGNPLPPFMGLTSWAAFTPGMGAQAMVMGDMVLFEDEVNPAMDAAFAGGLTVTALHNHFFHDEPRVFFMHIGGGGINIVAIHNHMEGENPRAIFLHYWGIGSAGDLAKGVKAALDAQAKPR